MKKINSISTKKLVLAAVLTALVVILQLLGSFIRFGVFSISLVLIPIVIGAATCGVGVGAWLGFVFSFVVLLQPDTAVFYSVNIFGTVLTVLAKGALAGFAAGVVYKLLDKLRAPMIVSVIAAAVVCPLVNTGVFLLGCIIFFLDTIKEWGMLGGYESTAAYMFLGLVGANFLFELGTNVILSPTVVKLMHIKAGPSVKPM